MIDILKDKLQSVKTLHEKKHILREELQILLLKSLYDLNAYSSIAFMGGTALRILYDTQRYSEDLDFVKTNHNNYNFILLINKIEKWLMNYGFDVEIKTQTTVVEKADFRFPGLLYNLGISNHGDEKLMIKLEVDSHPPAGAVFQNKIINSPQIFMVRTYDLPSLFSGKLGAILTRKYIKSRDYYDLFWFLSQKIKPNKMLLKNDIAQFTLDLNTSDWRNLVLDKLKSLDFAALQNDIRLFLKDPKDAKLLTLNNFRSLFPTY